MGVPGCLPVSLARAGPDFHLHAGEAGRGGVLDPEGLRKWG